MTKKLIHKVLYVRVAPELHDALAKLAVADKRSISNMAEVILERYIREQPPKLNHASERISLENISETGSNA